MFERFSDTVESRDLANAIADTESEVFWEGVNGGGDDRDAHNDIVERGSRMHSWEGEDADDSELFREALGEIPQGMAGTAPTIGEEALSRENAELRERLAALEGQLPQPERPDLFQDPRAFEENVVSQHRGAGLPIRDWGTPAPNKPDMFSDPEGYERYLLGEMDRRAGVAEHHETRFSSSLESAHERHGAAFEEAFRDISSMDPRDPQARALVATIFEAPDPGAALMQAHGALRGANQAARDYGGPPFAPMLSERRGPGAGRSMQGRGYARDTEAIYRSAAHAEEDDVFDSVWDN
jgi:hypothetical protein